MKVLILGSPSDFTSIVLRALVSAGVLVSAVALHRGRCLAQRPGALWLLHKGDVGTIAYVNGIPLIALDEGPNAHAIEAAARYAPDLLAIACYPRILDERWLTLAPCGAFNLHPSLLPAYRGPSPLFWQFRRGEKRMGITMHRANAMADAGPVVLSAEVPVAPGASAGEVQAVLVQRGSALLVDALPHIEAGTLHETVQDEARASWFGWPEDDAFRIPTAWSAERAFRFMRGVREWGRAFTVEARDETIVVDRALDFEARGGVEGAVRHENRVATIGFASGTLRVHCIPESRHRRQV